MKTFFACAMISQPKNTRYTCPISSVVAIFFQILLHKSLLHSSLIFISHLALATLVVGPPSDNPLPACLIYFMISFKYIHPEQHNATTGNQYHIPKQESHDVIAVPIPGTLG
jgi:hypothetical protein